MSEIALIWCGWTLLAIGVVGCFVPVLPGPPIACCSLLLVYLTRGHSSLTFLTLVTAIAVTVIVTMLDYVVPALGAKRFDCSAAGVWGCFVGTVVGLFFLPFGVILGPFVGALAGEVLRGKNVGRALKGAFGALLGYLTGMVLKLACCAYLAFTFWHAI